MSILAYACSMCNYTFFDVAVMPHRLAGRWLTGIVPCLSRLYRCPVGVIVGKATCFHRFIPRWSAKRWKSKT
jgi:hypothetical protein